MKQRRRASRLPLRAALLTLLTLILGLGRPGTPAAQTANIFPFSSMPNVDTSSLTLSGSRPAEVTAPAEAEGETAKEEGEKPVELKVVKEAAPPPLPLSTFETYVRSQVPESVAASLSQFGYEMFAQPPSTFAPIESAPVGPGYMLGPGDTLRIAIWGKINEEHRPTIDRDGRISLPVIGTLHLAGLTFAEAGDLIKQEVNRYFRDVSIDVSMGPLRTIQVYVVGRARQPGCFTISSLSTLVNALFAAGGPSKVGSLRDIQLKRNGATLIHLDLYDLLIRGDKTGDLRLLPEDVIFIPPVGPLVAMGGSVRVPAIYELKGELSVCDIIKLAGGINDTGFRHRLELLRVRQGHEQQLLEYDLERIMDTPGADIPVQGGDVLKVYQVASLVEDTVNITGPVRFPGVYGYKPGLSVRDLVNLAGGPRRLASEAAELSRIDITQEGPVTHRFEINLPAALAGDPAQNLLLQPDDYLFVRSIPEWEGHEIVVVGGQVRYPGSYTIHKGERLSSLLARAGGFTERAYPKGAVFTRLSAKELQQAQLKESLDRLEEEFLAESAGATAAALSPDEAALAAQAAARRQKLIARLRSVEPRGRISIKLKGPGELKGTPSDLLLEAGDQMFVPERPGYVQVMGSVYNPEAFIYRPDGTVSHYLRLSGGPTREADEGSTYVLRADGTVLSKRQEGWLGNRWDSDAGGWLTGFSSLRLDPGDTIIVPVELEQVNWLREVKDLTQVLYQIAVTAGIFFIAF